MQQRNPNTPAIANKLFMPSKRDSLSKQAKYWKAVMQNQRLHCIYCQRPLDPNQFSLDHYLPWSFVAHDELWNLIPTLPEVNSSKSNHLSDNSYLQSFVKLQHIGLATSQSIFSKGQWEKYTESYIRDLGFANREELLKLETLSHAYVKILSPLILLAESQGFSGRWKYRSD
jgi:hypothetical protein